MLQFFSEPGSLPLGVTTLLFFFKPPQTVERIRCHQPVKTKKQNPKLAKLSPKRTYDQVETKRVLTGVLQHSVARTQNSSPANIRKQQREAAFTFNLICRENSD